MSEPAGIRQTTGRTAVARQSTLGAAALLVLALCVLVNYFGWKYYQRWDWTSGEIYTLSEQSRNILGDLDRDIKATVFMDPQEEGYQQARELLSRYEVASTRIQVEEVDPARDLARAQELLDEGSVNVVIFDSGDDRRIVDTGDLIEYDYSGMQFGQQPEIKAFKGEQEFTAAILSLSEGKRSRAVFTVGHGEADVDDPSGSGLAGIKALLERNNFDVARWESLADPTVPEDTALLVIAGPKTAFTPPEAEAIGAYLDGGGRLLALLDPRFTPLGGLTPTGLEEVLAANGVQLGADIVIDPAGAVPFFGAETLMANQFGDHAASKPLADAGVSVILPLAQSLATTEVEGLTTSVLLETSAEGWGERDLETLDRVERGDEDVPGPVALALAVEAAPRPGESTVETVDLHSGEESLAESADAFSGEPDADEVRMVVIGDSDFVTDNQVANAGNAILFDTTVNWLVERHAAVAIPPRTPEQTKLNLTESQMSGARWLTVAVVPLAMLAAGFAVYRRRRR